MKEDRNDLAYWFPRLAATGVPVPRTEIVTTHVELTALLDGVMPPGLAEFGTALRAAVDRIGSPCFLRTGHTSGKHDWERTCYVAHPEDLLGQVCALVEFSEMADIIGLPTQTWAVREFLPLVHEFTAFRGMPVAVEFRWFIRDGKAVCHHPYWPPASIQQPSVTDWRERLDRLQGEWCGSPDHVAVMRKIIELAAAGFEGEWSIDIALQTSGDWVVIDMAEAERSFHWPGCPNAPEAAS